MANQADQPASAEPHPNWVWPTNADGQNLTMGEMAPADRRIAAERAVWRSKAIFHDPSAQEAIAAAFDAVNRKLDERDR